MSAGGNKDALEALKGELERFGEDHDASCARERRMLNITRTTGELLKVLLHAAAARDVLEIGTSNGYSTLWLAEAAGALGGSVTTVENDEHKLELAARNFERAGFGPLIRQVRQDAGRFLAAAAGNDYDFVFLDSDRAQYTAWWADLQRVLRPRSLLVVDNATSHPEEIADLVERLTDDDFSLCVVPVGKGELLAVKPVR